MEEKKEKNKAVLEQFVTGLIQVKVKRNGDREIFAKVRFTWADRKIEDAVRVQFLTGHHDGKVLVLDENALFKKVFVKFIANSQDYSIVNPTTLKITDQSGKSSLGNYEVLIEAIDKPETV